MHKKAFTLIELLVVVLIIGILASVALPQYQKAVLKSRYTQLEILLDALAKAETAYYLENSDYTNDFDALPLSIIKETTKKGFYIYSDMGVSATNTKALVGNLLVGTTTVLSYVIYMPYKKGRRECRVMQDKPSYHEICKNITGNTTSTTCGTGCKAYKYL